MDGTVNDRHWSRILIVGASALFLGAPALAAKGGKAPDKADKADKGAKGPDPAALLDVGAIRDKLALVTDGKSHYVAVLPQRLRSQLGADHALFYGDGKRFYSVRVQGANADGERWGYTFAEPRLAEGGREEGSGDLRFEPPETYTIFCGARKAEFKAVPEAEAGKLIAAATFERSPRKFRPYALARDSKGRYFYVDRGATKETSSVYRLFAGQKGALVRQTMTNIVSDSEGDVFSTKSGSLRMVIGRSEASWIEKEAPQKLVIVPIDFNKNVAMIYNELGVYSGERLGTPCDDL